MDVRIIKSRQHEPSIGIDDPRLRPGQRAYLLAAANSYNPVSDNGHGLGHWSIAIHRANTGIDEDQIRPNGHDSRLGGSGVHESQSNNEQ